MKKIFASLIMVLLLVGCGSSNKETVCKGPLSNSNNKGTQEQIITYKDDKVLKLTSKTVNSFDSNKDVLEAGFKLAKTQMSKFDGVAFDYSISDETATVTLTIDLEKADLSKLKEKGIIEQAFFDGDNVSYKKLIEKADKAGFTCK